MTCVAVAALAHHVQLVGVEQHHERLAEPCVVVDDEHAHLHAAWHRGR